MSRHADYLIVGNGIAGLSAALGVRERDRSGSLLMVHEEPYPTYFRAGLSEWMHGRLDDEELFVRPEAAYRRLGIETLQGRIARVDADAKTALLQGGDRLTWTKLLVATGASPIMPPWPGRGLDGVLSYRTWDDCRRIREAALARPELPVVIVGGGILGMEVAFDCKGLDVPCTLLVREPRPGSPIFGEAVGELLRRRMVDDGVDVITDDEVERFDGSDERVTSVITKGGREIACSAVVVAVGVSPSVDLLEGSADIDRWVKVDAQMCTNLRDVFAAGDVATVWDEALGRHQPIRTWEPAFWGGRVAGRNMAGADEVYLPSTSMNASLVYDLHYVLLGAFDAKGSGVETLVAPSNRGAYAHRELRIRDGRLVGGTFLVDRRQYLVFRQLIRERADVAAYQPRLFDDDFDANMLLAPGGTDYLLF